jgi:hypothetical protein
MRPMHIVALLAVGVVAAGIYLQSVPPLVEPARAAHGEEPAAINGNDETGNGRWNDKAEGFGQTIDDAKQDALKKAQLKVLDYLARQEPPIDWKPTPEFLVEEKMVKERETKVENLPKSGLTYWSIFDVEVGPKTLRKILELDRQVRVLSRQILLAKILAVLVAIFAAVGLYYRLDEATKGYYSGWLFLGGLALVGAVGTAVWMISFRI